MDWNWRPYGRPPHQAPQMLFKAQRKNGPGLSNMHVCWCAVTFFFSSVSLFKPIHSFICVCMCMFIYFFGEAALCQFAFQKYNVSVRRLSRKWKWVNLLENRRPQMAFCLQAKMIHCQKQMCNVWAVPMPAGSSLPSSKLQVMPVPVTLHLIPFQAVH